MRKSPVPPDLARGSFSSLVLFFIPIPNENRCERAMYHFLINSGTYQQQLPVLAVVADRWREQQLKLLFQQERHSLVDRESLFQFLQRIARINNYQLFIYKILFERLGKEVDRKELWERYCLMAGHRNANCFRTTLSQLKEIIKRDPDIELCAIGSNAFKLVMRTGSSLLDLRPEDVMLEFNDARLGLRELHHREAKITLGATDYTILLRLFRNGSRITPARELVSAKPSSLEFVSARRSMDVLITRLRRKLADTSIEIATLVNEGWFLRDKGELRITSESGLIIKEKGGCNNSVRSSQQLRTELSLKKAQLRELVLKIDSLAQGARDSADASPCALKQQIEHLLRIRLQRASMRFIQFDEIIERFGDQPLELLAQCSANVLGAYINAGHLRFFRAGCYSVGRKPLDSPLFETVALF
jgi:hypothetical protein